MAWTKEDLKAFQERLKIPMAGQYSYDGTGSFRDQEADGRYRSSSSLPEEEVRNYAYILRFHQNAIDATDGKNRGSGLSVRCFKNYPPLTLTF
ncbi:MAG: hypothetical protein LBO09_01700 [Candidatus Peribacteria bacterium]|jgi:hypothetical protein|nr:hypothetical protein [Candidatus Peribacteria bacterium]